MKTILSQIFFLWKVEKTLSLQEKVNVKSVRIKMSESNFFSKMVQLTEEICEGKKCKSEDMWASRR